MTATTTQQQYFRHIIDVVLAEEEHIDECLKSVNIKKVDSILSVTNAKLKSATYPEADGTLAPIPNDAYHCILSFKHFVKFCNSLPDPDTRIGGDWSKVTADAFLVFQYGVYDSDTEDIIQANYDQQMFYAKQEWNKKQGTTVPAREDGEDVPMIRPTTQQALVDGTISSATDPGGVPAREDGEDVQMIRPATTTGEFDHEDRHNAPTIATKSTVTAPTMGNIDGESEAKKTASDLAFDAMKHVIAAERMVTPMTVNLDAVTLRFDLTSDTNDGLCLVESESEHNQVANIPLDEDATMFGYFGNFYDYKKYYKKINIASQHFVQGFKGSNNGVGTLTLKYGEMEAFGVCVDDHSKVAGGKQLISTPKGVSIPIDFINGLPYVQMRPFTDQEWKELPHILLASDEWDPCSLDCILCSSDKWKTDATVPDADPRSSLFDMHGNYKLRTSKYAENIAVDDEVDEFFDAISSLQIANLDVMHTVADECAEIHSTHVHFLETFSHFSDDEPLDELLDFSAFPAVTRSQIKDKQQQVPLLSEPTEIHDDNTDNIVEVPMASPRPRDTIKQSIDSAALPPFFAWLSVEAIKNTVAAMTQYARISGSTLLKKCFKSPFPAMNVPRRTEEVATDFVYSDTPAIASGDTIAAIFVGRKTIATDACGIKTEKGFPATQHQNPNFAESHIDDLERVTNTLMDRTGTPPKLWLLCLTFVCFLLNNMAHPSLNWNTPLFAHLTDDTQKIIYCSEVCSALDHQNTNLRIDTIFDGEIVQEFFKSISKAAKGTTLQITATEAALESGKPLPKKSELLNSSGVKDSSTTRKFVPTGLIGRTFLMDKREDGQRHHAKIIEIVTAVDEYQSEFMQDEDATKLRVSIDNDKYDIGKRENNDDDSSWNCKRITAHQGPLCLSDPGYLGSQWNVNMESENGEISDYPLQIPAAENPDTFSDHGHKDSGKPPDGYTKTRVHLIFAVKHDGRHKARLVADGHLTDIPIESVYSGVVSLHGLRIVFFLAELYGLESWTADIGNAYLEAKTKEKIYIVAGPEFGKPKKYIEKMDENYKRLFVAKVKSTYRSPLEKGDHPEMDTSDFLGDSVTQLYQPLVGSLQWALSLSRFDIATAVMTLSSFRVAPRVGHLERAKRVVCYLAQFSHAKLRFRTLEPDYSSIPDNTYDWAHSVYGDIEEDIPNDIPTPLGKFVRITHYVDANLYHDMLTGRSVTGILDFLNQTPIEWYPKKQATVETATYGSEFVASRTCVERDIDLRTLLRYLGVPIRKTAFMFGDNESVVNSSSTPHAKLHKRHSALSFHRVREAIAAKIIRYHHIRSEDNPADILSKHWSHNQVWPMLNCVLFWSGDTIALFEQLGAKVDGEQDHMFLRQHGE